MAKVVSFLVGKIPALLILLSIFILLAITLPQNIITSLEFATIHTSRVKVTVGSDTFTGLPDMYDYSKHKEWFEIYLWNYCSGKYVDGKAGDVFCSQKGQVLYKLFGAWKYWGVGVRKEGVNFSWLSQGPRLLGWSYVVATGVGCLALGSALADGLHVRLKKVAVGMACLGLLADLTTAILAQITYGLLVRRADDDDIAITASSGKLVYVLNWSSTVLAFAALVMMTVRIHRRKGTRAEMQRGATEAAYKIISEPSEQEKDSDVTRLLGTNKMQQVVEQVYEPYRGMTDRSGRGLDVSRDHSRDHSRSRSVEPIIESSPYRDGELGA